MADNQEVMVDLKNKIKISKAINNPTYFPPSTFTPIGGRTL